MAEQQVVNNILVSSNSELHEFNIDVNRTGDYLACDLIECIQNYPILWNITLRGYIRTSTEKNNLENSIGTQMSV